MLRSMWFLFFNQKENRYESNERFLSSKLLIASFRFSYGDQFFSTFKRTHPTRVICTVHTSPVCTNTFTSSFLYSSFLRSSQNTFFRLLKPLPPERNLRYTILALSLPWQSMTLSSFSQKLFGRKIKKARTILKQEFAWEKCGIPRDIHSLRSAPREASYECE